VAALQSGGHRIRTVLQPGTALEPTQADSVESFLGDLCTHPDLQAAFEDVDAVIHLAATMTGAPASRFAETVTATERLLEAMSASSTRRLVLCSSFSVYDWTQARGSVDEDLPLSDSSEPSGGYAAAKLRQEQLAVQISRNHGWDLTILRPGFIWGPGNECPPGSIGLDFGPLHIVIGAGRRPPFAHVVNCAECFRLAVENPRAAGCVFNLVDEYRVTAWRFMGEHLKRSGRKGVRVLLPYSVARGLVALARAGARIVPAMESRLPSLFTPAEFAARCKPLSYDTRRSADVLGRWAQLDFQQCLQQTYDPR
jgi:UDP-glucose 4-epimerase